MITDIKNTWLRRTALMLVVFGYCLFQLCLGVLAVAHGLIFGAARICREIYDQVRDWWRFDMLPEIRSHIRDVRDAWKGPIS